MIKKYKATDYKQGDLVVWRHYSLYKNTTLKKGSLVDDLIISHNEKLANKWFGTVLNVILNGYEGLDQLELLGFFKKTGSGALPEDSWLPSLDPEAILTKGIIHIDNVVPYDDAQKLIK